MKVYNYNPATKEYIGTSEAFISPLDEQQRNHEIGFYDDPNSYLIPANSTLIEPPIKENGFALVFDVGAGVWIKKIDKRGIEIYNTVTLEKSRIENFGEGIPFGWTSIIPTSDNVKWDNKNSVWIDDIDKLKKTKSEELSKAFSETLMTGKIQSSALGIIVDARRFGDKNDLQNVEALLSHMLRWNEIEINFHGSTDSVIATIPMLETLRSELQDYGLSLYQYKHALNDKLKLAQTKNEIDLITWK